jgi:hypothetical protein
MARRTPRTDGRRGQRRRDRSAQFAVLAAAIVIGLLAAIAGSPRDATADANDRASSPSTAHTAATAQLPAHTLLLGHVAPDGRLDLLVAYGWAQGARTGTAVMIPANTMVEVPSLGPQALADVPRLASPKLLRIVIENALGVHFDGQVLLDDDELAAVLAPAGAFKVDFPAAARVDDSAGTIAFRPGKQRIDAPTAMRLLVGKGGDELSHLITVGAVIDGWQHALRRKAVADATVQTDPRFLAVTIGAKATMQTSTLPVERLATGGAERFRVRADDADGLLRDAFSWAMIAKGTRPRVELLNGVGSVGLTQAVAARIVPAGGEVTLTGNVPGFGVEQTKVVYYRPDARDDARRFAKALGVGQVVRAADAIDVVDVTVIAGKDYQPSR